MERKFTIFGKPGTRIKVTVTLSNDKTSGEKLSAIDLTPVKRVRRFSVVGDYYENNRLVSCGQCLTDLADVVESLTGERKEAGLEFLAIWDRWHLNDLRAEQSNRAKRSKSFLTVGGGTIILKPVRSWKRLGCMRIGDTSTGTSGYMSHCQKDLRERLGS